MFNEIEEKLEEPVEPQPKKRGRPSNARLAEIREAAIREACLLKDDLGLPDTTKAKPSRKRKNADFMEKRSS